MAQAKPACGSHPHDCIAGVLSIQYNTIQYNLATIELQCLLLWYHYFVLALFDTKNYPHLSTVMKNA